MKILELRFKNLNSLYGEWSIDFTSPEYGANGIFALTGPTGAGKSTILDAICLALYGATPRLGKITKSANEIMSRQTGDCYSEVTFESPSGKFRCHWSQHRARKKADGKLAESKHEFVDAISDQVLESKKRYVAEMVEQKTGMDFERFTRSILLAQGGFDTFLKADAEQKSKILEQITGTGIYTEISKRVHESQRGEREKLNVLMAETFGIELLNEEQLIEIKASLARELKKEAEIGAQEKEVEKSIAWLKGLDGLRNEINDLAEESKSIDLALEEFKPDRQRLALAVQAAELDGVFAALKSVRKQQGEDECALKEIKENLPRLDQAVAKKELGLESAEKLVLQRKKEQKSANITFQKVRTLDQQLKDKQQEINAGTNEYNRITEQLASHKKQFEQSGKECQKAKSGLEKVQSNLEENKQDESLIANLGVVEEQFINLVKFQSEISSKYRVLADVEKQRTKTTANLNNLSKKVKLEKLNLKNVQQIRESQKKSLDTLLVGKHLREYRTEKDGLLKEVAYLNKIASLEAERNQLQDGKFCPLCGSEVHPYAEGNIPAVDETQKEIEILEELIPKCEKLEQDIIQQQQLEKKVTESVTALEKNEAKFTNDLTAFAKQGAEFEAEIQQRNSALGELKTLLLTRLQPFGVKELPDGDVSPLLHSLKSRLTKWQENQGQKEILEKQLLEIETNLKGVEASIKTQGDDVTLKQESINKLAEDFKMLADKRNLLFGAKNPNVEEKLLNKAVLKGEINEKTCRTDRDEAKQTCHSAKVKIETLQKQIDERGLELQKIDSSFVLSLAQYNFVDEENYRMSCLPKLELEQLKSQVKALDERFISLQTKKKDRQNRLAIEVEKKTSSSPLDEVELLHKDLQGSLVQLTENIHGLRSNLSIDGIAREKIKEKQAVIDLQKNECTKWDKLHALIGSADGKKFRNFAQGLTFQLMVSHANRQLEKMTDRYLLIRDEAQPLELNVIDNYQGGEIRSTKNLSGGESFVVSLTLALGLSKMASRKVRVDSLFLDEGFGTLDEEALETALETLAGLQQDGKLIGVISHVPALKERISTQISVHPQSGGKSLVTGPGCNKVA